MKDWSFSALLLLSMVAGSTNLLAQRLDVPRVAFHEQQQKDFSMNDQLEFLMTSSIPPRALRARLFWGSKEELIARTKTAPPKSCVYYPSFVVGFDSQNGEVRFGLRFTPYSLRQTGNDSFDNQIYTVVLEKNTGTVEQFRLFPKDVDSYFQSGQEIVVIAPPELRSGARQTVAKVEEVRNAEGRAAMTSTPPVTSVPGKDQNCLLILTRHQAANTEEGLDLEHVVCGE